MIRAPLLVTIATAFVLAAGLQHRPAGDTAAIAREILERWAT